MALILFTSCNARSTDADAVKATNEQLTAEVHTSDVISTTSDVETQITSEAVPWTPDELWIMALTLAGECYDDKENDKRLVCEVILNRVSDGRFGDTIYDVLSAENQFDGYWHQSRPVSDNDLDVAIQALTDWYANDCKPLSKYLFFTAGENRENVFRETFN